MPSSGEPVGKRKRSNTSQATAKRHKTNPEKNNLKNKIKAPLRWFLRSRKQDYFVNGPSTSRGKDLSPKRGVKRKIAEEVNNINSRSKRSRKNKEVNNLDKKRTSVSELQEQRISVGTNEREESEEIVCMNDNGQCTKVTTGKESEKTTQVVRMSPSLEANPEIEQKHHAEREKIPPSTISIDEPSKIPNQQKENESDTDELEDKTVTIDDKIQDQSEEGVCQMKQVVDKATSTNEEEESNIKRIEDEKLSKEEIADEKDEVEIRNSSKAQDISSEESFAGNTSGVDLSSNGLNVPGKADILVKSDEKPKDKIMQRNPCLGSCDDTEQDHWQVNKLTNNLNSFRMEKEADQCCKSSGGVLAGVGLSEYTAPPVTSVQEEEEWTEEHLMALLDNPQCAQPPFPITLNEMDLMELEKLLDLYEENN